MDKNAHRYDDIINLPHPTSVNHPRMSLYDRAAQFSPFAALTGHDAAIKETARLTEQKIELSEDTISRLNEKLQIVADHLETEVTITYFVPDERKSGGAYVSYTGIVRRIDDYEHTLIMTDKTVIPIEQISEIESELFGEIGIYE
ncbi:MAG: hypothetical protein ACOYBH_03680 [Candidatus Alectryocaccobium sp.]|jgi:hypothetical protein